MQMTKLKRPAARLMSGVPAGDAVEPALDAAVQLEVGGIDGEDEPTIDDALLELVGQHELHAFAAS